MDWERLKNEAVTTDKEYRKKLEWRNMSQCRREVCISRENLEEFGFAARCPGCMSLLRGTARQAHTQNCRRRVEGPPRRTLRRDARRNTKTEPMRKEQHEQKSDAVRARGIDSSDG